MKKACLIVISMAIGAIITSPATAKSLYVSAGNVSVNPETTAKNMTLTVSGPNGFFKRTYKKNGTPDVSLMEQGQIADGMYVWELTGHTDERVASYKSRSNNGRGDNARNYGYKSIQQSGSFRMLNGLQVRAEDAPAEAPAKISSKNKFKK